ncbi:MAG: AraC family transcriptional regulator [Eubacteriales bacterium]|nr:AraC family transcriptional regulator [Eubacteriales bacterium]
MKHNELYKESWEREYIVGRRKSVSWIMADYHYHDGYEIYLTMTDNIKLYVNEKIYLANRGSLVVYNHLDMHRVVVPPDVEYERYIINFKPEYINGLSLPDVDLLDCFLNRDVDFCHMIQLNEEQLDHMLGLLSKALTYYNSPAYGSSVYSKITLAEILLYINPLFHTVSSPMIASKGYMHVQPVLKYIHDNINNPISVESITEKFYLSSHHLEFLFKQVTGSSINQYIIYRRILNAKHLLKQGISVSQVSETVGFNSASHFIRTFKKLTGVTPKQYAMNYYSLQKE